MAVTKLSKTVTVLTPLTPILYYFKKKASFEAFFYCSDINPCGICDIPVGSDMPLARYSLRGVGDRDLYHLAFSLRKHIAFVYKHIAFAEGKNIAFSGAIGDKTVVERWQY